MHLLTYIEHIGYIHDGKRLGIERISLVSRYTGHLTFTQERQLAISPVYSIASQRGSLGGS